ncbi:hypothetical protein PV387_39570 [Streptomyces sp. ME02-6987-2C]|uniref:hypothetical protein n=1 Tax=unclassified Streptomyces TaxID=2593676 RepID=UPI0029B6B5D1|nr:MULTISPECIES: hypothetical protein [unclassified Streptomyces]MDX3372019.1 hypothetical protein [Streptomyces sp. ME02-6987-2C]MDX3426370.1 hypothetical protein [Streptomyces sp. ME02-6985-2c]
MTSPTRLSSADGRLTDVFGTPVADLYETATGPDAPVALTRALQLRSFLALAEEQVARVRDRVRQAMDPERDMNDLSADDLREDAYWLEAALDARNGYRSALDHLLLSMPPVDQPRSVRLSQPTVTTLLPDAVPAPQRAGTARARRP